MCDMSELVDAYYISESIFFLLGDRQLLSF